MAGTDYYSILGLGREASDQEIKRAYRQAAIRWHPDKNPGDPAAEERFKQAAEAYSVLGDPEKRARYDRFGAAGVGAGAGGFNPEMFTEFGDLFGGLGIFEELFGAAFGGRRGRGARRRGADLRYDMEIEFLDAAHGKETTITIPRLQPCESCGGSGSRAGGGDSPCPQCGGGGQLRYQQGFFTVARTCGECRGRGTVVRDPCPDCRGQGRNRSEKRIDIRIPAGVESGSRLRLVGQGEAGERGAPAGDLYVVLRVRDHDFFERDGLDLHCRFPINFTQAVLGAEVKVPSLDGHERMDVPAGTQPGTVLRVRGKGIRSPNGHGAGDFYVHLQVVVPRKLTRKQRELLEDFAKLEPKGPQAGDKNFFRKVRDLFS